MFQTAKRQVSKEAKRAARCLITAKCSLDRTKEERKKLPKKCGHSLNLFFPDSTLSVAHDFSGQDDSSGQTGQKTS